MHRGSCHYDRRFFRYLLRGEIYIFINSSITSREHDWVGARDLLPKPSGRPNQIMLEQEERESECVCNALCKT